MVEIKNKLYAFVTLTDAFLLYHINPLNDTVKDNYDAFSEQQRETFTDQCVNNNLLQKSGDNLIVTPAGIDFLLRTTNQLADDIRKKTHDTKICKRVYANVMLRTFLLYHINPSAEFVKKQYKTIPDQLKDYCKKIVAENNNLLKEFNETTFFVTSQDIKILFNINISLIELLEELGVKV
jgi:SepF-like predicted cell division protein (DUF552 family)